MTRYKDPRKALNGFVFVLAGLLFILAGGWAWNGYAKYRSAELTLSANEAADLLMAASSIHAVERGISSAALGVGTAADAVTLQRIADLRREGDRNWHQAQQILRALADHASNRGQLSAMVERADQDYQALQDARMRLDVTLNGGAATIQGPAWIAAMTAFINGGARAREAFLTSVDMAPDVAFYNHTLKQLAWLVSEHMGRERGILSYYIGAGLPVTEGGRDDLRMFRGVVEHSLDEIVSYQSLPGLDSRVRAAIDSLEKSRGDGFEALRKHIQQGLVSGAYGISAEQWIEQATAAINRVLQVSVTISAVTAESAHRALNNARQQLIFSLGVMLASLALVVVYVFKVRSIANALFHQKELAEVTLHSIGDAVITTDGQARVEYINPIAEELTGWSTAQARGRLLKDVFHIVKGLTRKEEPNPVEECLREQRVVGMDDGIVLIRPDGQEIHIEDSAAPIRDREGNVVGAVMVFYDVTAVNHAPHLLSYHATHDPLTRLINRREFERRLDEHLIRSKNSGEHHALCYIDIDQFKIVNDTCGHTAGDKLLRELADFLRRELRENDTLARLGGDEFGVLLVGCELEPARRIAETLRKAIKEFRFVWEGKTFELGASIGLVPITADSAGIAEVLGAADAACFAAKENGRNAVQVYDATNTELVRRHGEMHWVSRITQALRDDRFVLFCQMIMPLDAAQTPHCEILVRMLDEQGKPVSPMSFIPAAERFNLMAEIDRWVIYKTLEQIEEYCRQHGEPRISCNINISGASLARDGFREFMQTVFSTRNLPPGMICFEITETAAMTNLGMMTDFINSMKAGGCKFALDDFGSGLSSFTYLKNLPVDFLKIDGSLIQGIEDDAVTYGMVQAIQRVGHIMGIQTIGEYVSSLPILEKLRELEIDYAQGYAISQPIPFTAEVLAEETIDKFRRVMRPVSAAL